MAGSLCLAFSMGESVPRSLLFKRVVGFPVHFGRPWPHDPSSTRMYPNRHGVGDDIDVGHAVGAFH